MHFDKLEARAPELRERALFKDLRAILRGSRPRAAALRKQLQGIKIEEIKTRADLAKIPVTRKSDLVQLQADDPPFGGLTAAKASGMRRLLVSPGPIFEPDGHGKDWWGAARALYAAGIRRGDIVLNTFSYHLTPGGHIMESGAAAIGCPVIPAGPGNTEQQLDAIRHYRPRAYCGTPDFLKIILDKAVELKRDVKSLECALVSGAALPASLRQELEKRGVMVRQCYATAELGVIAYETSTAKGVLNEGMVVNEHIILEIVRPGTGDPVQPGEVGEVVVTRLNKDYPLLRLATGDLSALLPGKSPCGRTHLRIKGWMGRADQTTKVKGMFVHPKQIADVAARHPEIGRARLVVTREKEQDAMALHVECAKAADGMAGAIAETLQAVTKLKGSVVIAKPGSLPNDGKVIADERPIS
jgi:phenylacetate-CoA ligase